jgi:VCBS repeat-containing protein
VTFPIFVAPKNNIPVAQNDFFEVDEDTAFSLPSPGLLVNDVDLDSYPEDIYIESNTLPAHGSIVVYTDGSFDYTPDADFNGIDTFTYTITDTVAKRDGPASNTATVSINVVSVNDKPVAWGESYTTDQATVLNVDGPGILKNDYDVDSPVITPVILQAPIHGSLRIHVDGGFVYTPDRFYVGLDSWIYQVSDSKLNSGNVTTVVNVTKAPNVAPVAVYDAYNTNEGSTLTVSAANGVLHNDRDLEGDAITAVLNITTSRGQLTLNSDGSFTYVPDAYTYGYDFFHYWAYDGQALSKDVGFVWILVHSVDNRPVPQNDAYYTNEDSTLTVSASNGVLHNDIDIDSASFNATISVNPSHGSVTLNSDGSFVYVPAANYYGFDQFLYTANDGTLTSGLAVVEIRVDAVNDAPVATEDWYETNQNIAIRIDAPGVLANDWDIDSLIIKPVIVSSTSNGTLRSLVDGGFEYTPDFFFHGNDTFTYKLNDGYADSNTVTVQIFVNDSNNAPVAKSDHYIIKENNDGYDFTADYLLSLTENDNDV